MNANLPVPFLDLVTPHVELQEELVLGFRKALHSAAFIGGPLVEQFEQNFARFCDARHCVGVGSGTDALRFALMACGIRPGDVVLTSPHTFIATTEAISQTGALPEFVDIDEATYNISAPKLREYLSTKCTLTPSGQFVSIRSNRPVTAIVPVHLYGQMADMDPIMALARQYNLKVVEDACQAHGARYFSSAMDRWVTAGSVGHAAAFSFYPGKNLGACGEAGAVTTNDEAVSARVRTLRDHGQAKKYYHDIEGYNGRLDAIQASFLCTKLPHLERWNADRQTLAGEYNRLLAGTPGLTCPFEPSWSRAVYHLYVVQVENRDGLIEYLKDKEIGTGIHYPVPLHLQKAYADLEYSAEELPVSTRIAPRIVSLPMFPQLTRGQQSHVVDEVLAFLSGAALVHDSPAATIPAQTPAALAG